MIKRLFVFVAIIFGNLFSIPLVAQNGPAIKWEKIYGGNRYEYVEDLKPTSDGGYIVAGYSDSDSSFEKSENCRGFFDYWVLKIDANGNKLWEKTFGGDDDDYLQSVAQTTDGGYILAGYSESGLSGDKSLASKGLLDFWIIKLDSKGNKLWDKTIGGFNEDWLYTVVQTPDGGCLLGGASSAPDSGIPATYLKGAMDYWIIKLDPGGTVQWDKTYGGDQIETLRVIIPTTDGGYMLGGTSGSENSGDRTDPSKGLDDYWVVKIDAIGNKQWDKALGSIGHDDLRSVVQTWDGGYVLGGFNEGRTLGLGISGDKTELSRGDDDIWVVKLDGNGNKLWDKTLGGNLKDWLFGMDQTTDGNLVVGGYSYSGVSGDKTQNSKGYIDYWFLKLSSSGKIIWDRTIGGRGNDGLRSVTHTANGGFILGGSSESPASDDKSESPRGDFDFWIIKVGPDDNTGNQDSNTRKNLTIYPNPNPGTFNLKVDPQISETVSITINDLIGRLIYQKEMPIGTNQILEDISVPAAKGMYLFQIKSGNQTSFQKIILE
jgi:hypothetical protein